MAKKPIKIKINTLQEDFSALCEQFEKNLTHHYKIFFPNSSAETIHMQVKKKMQAILKTADNTVESRYDAILLWCQEIADQDEFKVIKKSFLELHQKIFSAALEKQALHQSQFVHQMNLHRERLDQQYKKDLEYLSKAVAHQKEMDDGLKKIIRQFPLANVSEKNQTDFSNMVPPLKFIAGQFKIKKLNTDVYRPLKRAVPQSNMDYLVYRKTTALINLDSAILARREEIKKEGWISRLFRFFSSVARQEDNALAAYQNNVTTEIDSKTRYACAVEWMTKYKKNEKSQLFQKVINPFKEEVDQITFESLQGNLKPQSTLVNKRILEMKNAAETYNQHLDRLNNTFSEQNSTLVSLQKNVIQFVDTMNSVNEDALGYPQNEAKNIDDAIERLRKGANISREQELLNEAKRISQQISMVSRETPSEAIHTISTAHTISTIEKSADATKIVTDTIQQVIADTKIYGGLGTNSLFMGSRQATVLVNQLGTEDQKKQFSTEVIPAVVKKSIIAFEQLEKDCVTTLEKSITAGNLKSTLATWRDAYDKHKRFFKTVPDTQSEIIYRDVRQATTIASQCHNKGDHKLKELVERVSSAWIGGVFYSPLHGPVLSSFVSEIRKWTLEEIDLFMQSYGTEAQIKQWNNRLPDFILESEDPDSHIESTKMRIFLIKKDVLDVKKDNPIPRMSV